MSKQFKRWLLFFGVLGAGIGAPLAYLLTLGHCYVPLEAFDYRNEETEVREYDGFYVRMYSESTRLSRACEGILRLRDKIVYPGRMRLCAAIAKIEGGHGSFFALSGPDSEMQQSLEAMGYAFPTGCSAGVDTNNVYRIKHYPSMLNRIEKDLGLKLHRRASPNKAAAGKAGTASLLAIEHRCPGLPEPGR